MEVQVGVGAVLDQAGHQAGLLPHGEPTHHAVLDNFNRYLISSEGWLGFGCKVCNLATNSTQAQTSSGGVGRGGRGAPGRGTRNARIANELSGSMTCGQAHCSEVFLCAVQCTQRDRGRKERLQPPAGLTQMCCASEWILRMEEGKHPHNFRFYYRPL